MTMPRSKAKNAARLPIRPPDPEPKKRSRVLGAIGSLLAHALLVILISQASVGQDSERKQAQRLVEFEVIQKVPEPAPLPEPEPAPAPTPPLDDPAPLPPPKPKPIERTPKPKPAPKPLPPLPKDVPPPPPEVEPSDAPPPPNTAPPKNAKPNAPVRIGISMSSTSATGSFATPVGNTLYGTSPKVAVDPKEVQPYASSDGRYAPPAGGRYVPPARVTTLPKVSREVRAIYPETARRAGIEGQVVIRLRIGDKGQVLQARVVESSGHGFDEAALAAVKQFSFQPGTMDGAPIATDITYTYTFLLD